MSYRGTVVSTIESTIFRVGPPSGSDDYDAFQAAITAAENNGGGTVMCDSGETYILNKGTAPGGLKLARNNAGTNVRITIDLNGAKVQLSSNVPRFLDFNKIADHDTFQYWTIQNGVIDAANIGGKHHVIVGTYQNGVTQSRINIKHARIKDITVLNVFSDGAVAPNHRLGSWMFVARSVGGTATDGPQNEVSDILYEDVRIEGGNGGIGVGGTGVGAADFRVYLNDVTFRRCWHSTMRAPTAFFASTNFHMGSLAYGGRALIDDCYGYGSGDTGVETNGLQDMTIRKTKIEDCWNVAFYWTDYNGNADVTSQRTVYDDCSVEVHSNNGLIGQGFRATCNFGLPLGTMEIRKCSYWRNAAGVTANTFPGISLVNITAMQRLNVNGFTHNIEGFTNSATVWSPSAIGLSCAPASETICDLKNIAINFSGTHTGGTSTICGLQALGACTLYLDGYDVDFNVIGVSATGLRGIDLGANSPCTLRGRIANYRVRRFADDVTPRGIIVRPLATLTIPERFTIENCDFSAMTAGAEVVFATGVENKNKLVVRNCIPRTGSIILTGAATAAATLALPLQPDAVHVSGNTNITAGVDVVYPLGSRMVLIFDGTPTVTDGSNLKLAGNFVATADDTLTLASDSTNWFEVARSVN